MASIFIPRCPSPIFHFWPKTAKFTPGSSKILRTAARMESSSVAANAAADSTTDHQDSESSVADTVVQYVVLRRDLIDTWPLGSVVTQGCHASVAAIWSNKDDAHTLLYCSPSNLDSMHKVTLEVKGEAQILNLSEKLKTAGIAHKLWIEQPENFPTCLATKPYPKSFVSSYFKKLKLSLMPVDRRSFMGPFPVPRPTIHSDENDSGLGRLQADPHAKNRHVRWSDEMDGFMITSLVEQVLAGHKRSDNGFTSFQVAKAMERVLNGCGVTVSDKNVRARLKTLKKEHAEVRQLLNMSDFGFDPKTGRIVADTVAWDDFIKGNPKFGKWRSKLCPRFDEMETIFGNDVANRERSVSGFEHFSLINATDESVNEVDMKNVEMDNSPITARKRTVEKGINKAKRRRAQLVDESTITLLRIAESSSKIAQAMEMQATLDTRNHVNWQLILEKLEAMNLDMKDIMEVMKAFRFDDGLAKVFLNLTSEKYMRALVFDKLGRDPP